MSAGHDDDAAFDDLIASLHAEGHDEDAARLDDLLHHTAWTTGSELLGELGLALVAFKQQNRRLSPALRKQVADCLRIVRLTWPQIR